MTTYEKLTIIISSIMALVSVLSFIASLKVKKEVITKKNEISTLITEFELKLDLKNNQISNSGTNKGVMAGEVSGGVTIGSRK